MGHLDCFYISCPLDFNMSLIQGPRSPIQFHTVPHMMKSKQGTTSDPRSFHSQVMGEMQIWTKATTPITLSSRCDHSFRIWPLSFTWSCFLQVYLKSPFFIFYYLLTLKCKLRRTGLTHHPWKGKHSFSTPNDMWQDWDTDPYPTLHLESSLCTWHCARLETRRLKTVIRHDLCL